MTYFDYLWNDLFGVPISSMEEEVIAGIAKKVDEDSSVMVLAAITVRMLYRILIEDAASPIRTMRNFGQALEENRRNTTLVSDTYERLNLHLTGIEGTLVRLENALSEARELAMAKTGYSPFLGHYPTQETDNYFRVSGRAVVARLAACFLVCFVGCAIAFAVFG